MTSRDSTQVRPAETDSLEQRREKNETINLFEVLEDRYAYEGFNKFIFYCFVFFAMYQMIFSSFRNGENVAGDINLIRNRLIPSSKDLFEREENFDVLPNNIDDIRNYITKILERSKSR